MSLQFFIHHIDSHRQMSAAQMRQALELLLDPNLPEEEIRNFLVSVSAIDIQPDLLVEVVQMLRERSRRVDLKVNAIDTCGTGGDQKGLFNFSTAAALVAASCGAHIAKHGNRSITSKSGSADLLEALKIPIELEPQKLADHVEQKRFGFMLAPLYHPAISRVQKVRKTISQVTLFNFLGPLLNPARVKRQLVGVFDPQLRPILAETFYRLGVEKVWVIWGEGGVDEMSLSGKTWVSEVTSQGIEEKVFEPEDGVLRRCDLQYLKGGDGVENAKILENIFSQSFFGPMVNGILWNSAAALCVAGLSETMLEGVRLAKIAIQEGKAWNLLQSLRKEPI